MKLSILLLLLTLLVETDDLSATECPQMAPHSWSQRVDLLQLCWHAYSVVSTQERFGQTKDVWRVTEQKLLPETAARSTSNILHPIRVTWPPVMPNSRLQTMSWPCLGEAIAIDRGRVRNSAWHWIASRQLKNAVVTTTCACALKHSHYFVDTRLGTNSFNSLICQLWVRPCEYIGNCLPRHCFSLIMSLCYT